MAWGKHRNYQRSRAGVEADSLSPGAFDALQADEVDLRSRLWDQLRIIAYHSNRGDSWKGYVNAVEHLETLLKGYLILDSTHAKEYRSEMDKALGEFKKKEPPEDIKYGLELKKRDWEFSQRVKLAKIREEQLMIFLLKAGFFPRLALR